jgi:microcystin-dependent protein
MKILIDVDLKIPRWVRVGSLLIVTAGLVVTTTMVSADVPNTFKTGDLLTAQTLNDNFSSQDARLTALETSPGLPSGTVVAFGGTAVPVGWLPCDGTSLDGTNAQYAALYAAIGTAFGGNTTSKAFNLPDLRGRFLRGVDAAGTNDLGAASRTAIAAGGNTGPKVGTLEASATALPTAPFSTDMAPDHTHAPSNGGNFVVQEGAGGVQTGGNALSVVATTAPAGHHSHVVTTGGDAETRPVNVAINYIIKL